MIKLIELWLEEELDSEEELLNAEFSDVDGDEFGVGEESVCDGEEKYVIAL